MAKGNKNKNNGSKKSNNNQQNNSKNNQRKNSSRNNSNSNQKKKPDEDSEEGYYQCSDDGAATGSVSSPVPVISKPGSCVNPNTPMTRHIAKNRKGAIWYYKHYKAVGRVIMKQCDNRKRRSMSSCKICMCIQTNDKIMKHIMAVHGKDKRCWGLKPGEDPPRNYVYADHYERLNLKDWAKECLRKIKECKGEYQLLESNFLRKIGFWSIPNFVNEQCEPYYTEVMQVDTSDGDEGPQAVAWADIEQAEAEEKEKERAQAAARAGAGAGAGAIAGAQTRTQIQTQNVGSLGLGIVAPPLNSSTTGNRVSAPQ
jgi:hypothetical protein